MKALFTLRAVIGAILAALFMPVSRKRAQLGGLDLGGDDKELLGLIEEVKSAAVGAADANSVKLLELADRLLKVEQRAGRDNSGDDGGAPNGMAQVARLALKSPELEAFRRAHGKGRVSIPVKSFASAIEQKAVTLISADAGNPAARSPEMPPAVAWPARVAVRSLIPTRTITTGSIDFVQTTVAGVAGVQATEGAIKSQIDVDPNVVNAKVVTIAGWTKASKQVISDNLLLDDFITGTLRDSLVNAEEAEILKGVGTPGYMNGIWTQASAYNRNVVGDKAIDTLRRACTQVQLQRGLPTGIVVSPEGLEALEVAKDAGGAYLTTLVVDRLNQTKLWRTDVIVSAALGSSEFLCGDFRYARIYDRETATIEMSSENSDDFVRNLVTILAESRLALAVLRPTVFVKGTFA